jgi:hypothetical protein
MTLNASRATAESRGFATTDAVLLRFGCSNVGRVFSSYAKRNGAQIRHTSAMIEIPLASAREL